MPLRERAAMTALFADLDPHSKLVRYAAIGRGLWDRLGDLVPVIMAGAAAGDPDLVALVATIRRESRGGATVIVRYLAAAGALRAGLDEEQAIDEFWLLLQPESHGLLVERGGPSTATRSGSPAAPAACSSAPRGDDLRSITRRGHRHAPRGVTRATPGFDAS